MSNIEKSTTQEIVTLHNEIGGYLKLSLQKAIRVGELLTEQKASLKHGEWLAWIRKNLPFTYRTADRYTQLFNAQDTLKLDTVSNLNEAYKAIGKARSIEMKKVMKEKRCNRTVAFPTPKIISREAREERINDWKHKITKVTYDTGKSHETYECIDPEYLSLKEKCNKYPEILKLSIGAIRWHLELANRFYPDGGDFYHGMSVLYQECGNEVLDVMDFKSHNEFEPAKRPVNLFDEVIKEYEILKKAIGPLIKLNARNRAKGAKP